METRKLGKTNLTVSRVCCGTMTFGGQADEATSLQMVDTCLDHGINFFDTANVYNNGVSETIVGKAMRGRRDRFVLATKAAGKMGPGADESGLSRAAINRAIDESLRRLQTDYVDLFYLHMPDYAVPIEESLDAANALVRAGKVRHLAASNYASWQVTQMLWLADRKHFAPVTVMQPMFNLIARGLEQEFLPMCREFGLATVVYNPLAGGLLTGKQKIEAPLPGTRFDLMKTYLDRYWNEANFHAIDELSRVARDARRSLVSLSLNWMLHHTPVDAMILGASKLQHLRDNLAALDDGPLPTTAVAACDRIWERLRGPAPKYNR